MQIAQPSSWQDQFRDSIRTTKELAEFLNTEIPETNYPILIPKDFAFKIKMKGPDSPLWKQFVPQKLERNQTGHSDPIGDQVHAKKNGIIHRYKNRLLFNPTTVCPVNCRYCFRKNELFGQTDIFKSSLEKLCEYLLENPKVEEVILTGGDPLILSNDRIENILKVLSMISSVKYIRFHSRTPIIFPNRLNDGLANIFNKYSSIFETISLAIHTNHIEELSEQLKFNLKKFYKVNLLSQTVLLKDINDSPFELATLFRELNKINIRPYYLHHPDIVKGAMHFHMPLIEGRKIYGKLRELLPGWLIPNYVVDSPDGTGKVNAYNPESLEFSGQMLDRFNNLNASRLI